MTPAKPSRKPSTTTTSKRAKAPRPRTPAKAPTTAGELLEAIARRARRLARRQPARLELGELVRQYYRNVAQEDLSARSVENLAGAVLAHLELGRHRRDAAACIRVYNPTEAEHGWTSPHTIVEIVHDDMPFLVDSSTMTLNRLGHEIHLTIHPVLMLERTPRGQVSRLHPRGVDHPRTQAESFIHFEILREPDPNRHDDIVAALESTLADVRAAVADWPAMVAKLRVASAELPANAAMLSTNTVLESCRLLDWMADDHFTLLGYREYRLDRRGRGARLVGIPETGLGILRDRPGEPPSEQVLNPRMQQVADSREPLVITKANTRATVHRPGYLDYVGVKVFDRQGRPVRERRFLGLYTSSAYSRQARDIPVLREKLREVLDRSGVTPGSHRAKALQHTLDSYPRDELFQISIEDLLRIAHGILNLQERHRVRLLIRREDFQRFYSCLVFVPRDRYRTSVRLRIEDILREELHGEQIDTNVEISESVLARMHVIVRSPPDSEPRISFQAIERRIEETVTTWQDRLREDMLERFDEAHGNALYQRYCEAFPAAYREDVSPREAGFDIERIDDILAGRTSMATSLYRPPQGADERLRFKICRSGAPLPLSQVVPMLEHMGVDVVSERPYRLRLEGDQPVYIQDLDLIGQGGRSFDPHSCGERFQHCFRAALEGHVESDGHNRLVLLAQLDWRQIVVLRACTKYLVQTGMPFSQAYLQEVLTGAPALAAALVDLFAAQFDPETTERARQRLRHAAEARIEACLNSVSSLDEDRILRAYYDVVRAMLRTNHFQYEADQAPKAYLSFKLDPARLPELPRPRPRYEIFVYSPRMEGVHLRAAEIARGGLRWSDRREDFRSEILGLMKAQQVKNTVIVPNGAKGGFVCKRLPEGDRAAVQTEVRACYRMLIRGLLDITDNIVGKEIQPPPRVRRLDGDDPYLVVAADKGTATFSDLANTIAAEYDFWLSDAFASGGSHGYDHKKMGITARGAWEAVKRHFRELGIDVTSQTFTVAGIGDMSGDVFGNGMLQSDRIRLLAAFDHRHIFIDPDPDPALAFAERKRLFALPASSWEDYRADVISSGGGVYSRAAKSIELSAAAAQAIGVRERRITPPQLIQAILRMPVDLLWNGGIGTYVKAAAESHEDVGDRANIAVRVNGRELRCKILGEGGNLGITQRGRIEYAHTGGRLNTDFIDNSGGVDCSDREVNIKILLREAVDTGGLRMPARNRLLERMTDEVAELVLRTNYQQTQAISVLAARALERSNENASLLRWLERRGLLDRDLEFLPDDEEIADRRARGRGLTRPELAVMLSYAKIELYDALCASDITADPYLSEELSRYFPQPLRKRFAQHVPGHRLARQIVAMLITSSMINRMGPTFPMRAQEETGADAASVARAYTIARDVIGMRELWDGIEGLDARLLAPVQLDMLFESARQLRNTVYWFLRHHAGELDVTAQVQTMRTGVSGLMHRLPELMPAVSARRLERATQEYVQHSVPEALARRMASLPYSLATLDIVEVARQGGRDPADAARAYFELGRALKLDWLKQEIEKLAVEGRWQALGRGTLRGSVHDLQRQVLQRCLGERSRDDAEAAVSAWLKAHRPVVVKTLHTLTEMQASKRVDFATLSVALEELRRLAAMT